MSGSIRAALAAAALLSTTTAPALAHGFLVSVRGEGSSITGRLYYSDGTPGAGQYVGLTDLDDPGAQPRGGPSDAEGRFRFTGVAGHRYRVLAQGEEGHETEMLITLAPGAKGTFVDRDAAAAPVNRTPPAWAVIGALLALSAIPALLLRQRGVEATARG